jgi:hypothetical protein
MAYGTYEKSTAECKADELRLAHPENDYRVELHDPMRKTFGVVRYEPYIESHMRFAGFEWAF